MEHDAPETSGEATGTGERPGGQESPAAAAPFAEHLIRNGATVGAATGALLYGVIALAYDRYYRVLGLSPELAGVTHAEIVERTAIVLALVAALIVGAYAVVYVVCCLVAPRGAQPTVGLVSGALTVPLGVALLATTNSPVLLSERMRGYTATVAGALLGAAMITLLLRLLFADGGRRRAMLVAVWVGAGCFAYVNIVNGTTARAEELAEGVLAGKPIPPNGLTFMYDVHADPACFSSVQPSTVGTPRYGLYLGEAHDWIALYDPEKRTTTRRSQRELTVRLLPSEDWPEATDDLAGRC